jgi:hypothetical protein
VGDADGVMLLTQSQVNQFGTWFVIAIGAKQPVVVHLELLFYLRKKI